VDITFLWQGSLPSKSLRFPGEMILFQEENCQEAEANLWSDDKSDVEESFGSFSMF